MSRGFCRVCSSPFAKEINKRLANGQPATQISEWLGTKQFPITRQTLYKHREHITDPKQTFVEEARKNPAIKNVTDDEFLASVVDAAAARVAEDPTAITVEQGLKAVATRAARGQKNINVFLAIAQLVTQREPIIEGEYREILPGPEPAEELVTSE